jgi:hypothetical protein
MGRELRLARLTAAPGKVEFFPGIQPKEAAGYPSPAVRGCYLSHLGVLRAAEESGLGKVLVMEDDLTISRRFILEQESLVDQLRRQPWDFVYFGHVLQVESTPSATLVPYPGDISMGHFYGINGGIFRRLITFLEEAQHRPPGHREGGPMHLDAAYSSFRYLNPDVSTLVATPNLGWQRASASDLDYRKWFDNTPGLRGIAGLVRWGRNLRRGH